MQLPDPQPPPGKGLLGWLGRQLGYVVHAVQKDVQAPAKSNEVVYRQERVHEAQHPEMPGVVLRRRVIDEVVQGGIDKGQQGE